MRLKYGLTKILNQTSTLVHGHWHSKVRLWKITCAALQTTAISQCHEHLGSGMSFHGHNLFVVLHAYTQRLLNFQIQASVCKVQSYVVDSECYTYDAYQPTYLKQVTIKHHMCLISLTVDNAGMHSTVKYCQLLNNGMPYLLYHAFFINRAQYF